MAQIKGYRRADGTWVKPHSRVSKIAKVFRGSKKSAGLAAVRRRRSEQALMKGRNQAQWKRARASDREYSQRQRAEKRSLKRLTPEARVFRGMAEAAAYETKMRRSSARYEKEKREESVRKMAAEQKRNARNKLASEATNADLWFGTERGKAWAERERERRRKK